MKRILFRILLLFAIFVGSLIFFMLLLNRYDASSTKAMSGATLPVLYMREDGVTVNRMNGYRQEVNEATFRESLTPLASDRNLTVEISAYDRTIGDVGYQVTSIEDGSVIENGRLSLKTTDGNMTADFHLDQPITVGQEYMLRFSVDVGEENPVYYYTRLVQNSSQNLKYYLDYTDAFYNACINNSLTDQMLSQLETESSSVSSSLHTVTLKSDKEQITWGDLAPNIAKKAVPTILEVNDTTVSIGLDYIVSAQDENGEREYYTVSEYYRMRRTQNEVVLIDFERTATQFFDGNLPVLTEEGINLGITGKDVEYVTDDSQNIAAFVQSGELWQYDRNSNKVCRIFSFAGDAYTDDRTIKKDYDISVSSVSDDGNTTFIVYGYMASGDHEGSLGIGIYRYYSESNTTAELMFIPLSDGFEVMSQGLSALSYVNGNDQCFLFYDDKIYSIKLGEEPEISVLQTDLNWETISVSESQRIIAWGDNSEGYSSNINILNLETGETRTVSAESGDHVRAFGFVGEDMVYGTAHAADCYTDSSGNDIFPMYDVKIVDPAGEVVKDYHIDNIYITSITIDDKLIELKRAQRTESGGLKSTTDDQLICYELEDSAYVNVLLTVSARRGTQVELVFSTSGEVANLLNLDTRYPSEEESVRFEVPEMVYDDSGCYYVYAYGGLYAVYDRVNSAVIAADNNVGTVLNDAQEYVWERGNIKTAARISAAQLPQGLLSAPVDEAAFAQAVGEDYEVWNLTGCSVDAIKYFISNGYAVTGKWSDTQTVLIVGYDIYNNIWLYNSGTGQDYAVSYEDAVKAFGENGNIFVSYH